MAIQAVLIADIVNSTSLKADRERKILNALTELFSGTKMEFFRGDSFQAYIKDPKAALRFALQARASVIRLFKDEAEVSSDIRISIGVGKIDSPVRSLKTAKGEAFVLSGRQFDVISKSTQR